MQLLRDIAHKRIRLSRKDRTGHGTFTGVFLPSFITMTGALLFLNLGSILASSGLFTVVLALILAVSITLVTAFSVTSMASNIRIGRGGMYYMLSRCFGFEVGAAVGIALYIAHTLAASLCIMGLSSSLAPFFPTLEPKFIRLAILVAVSILTLTSTKLALKIQVVVFGTIMFSLAAFIMGPYYGADQIGNATVVPTTFWHTFAFLYPALIGIEAGAAMSGRLKKPRFSIIVGTLFATIAGFLFYLILTFTLWTTVPAKTLLTNNLILQYLSPLGPVALIGLWSATLFSSMGCLITAPSTLSAMAEDGLFPKIFINSQRSTFLTAILVGIGLTIGAIYAVVPILTNVILIVYGMLNLAVAIEHFLKSPSWRPSVRVPPFLSIAGALLCFFSMFMMNPGEAFFACGLVGLIIYIVERNKVATKWDDMRRSILFSLTRFAIYRLYDSKKSLRSWRPNFLVLSESASLKTPLLGLADQMSHGQGFLTLASVLKKGSAQLEEADKWERVIRSNLKKKKVDALVEVTVADTLIEGLQNIITHFGIRPLTPNTVVLGESIREDHFDSYLKLIEAASKAKRNILIVRGDYLADNFPNKEIDIWYDPAEKKSCEMMIILAHLLKKSKAWRGATITLKCSVNTRVEKESKTKYFENYFDECRLEMKLKIYTKEKEDHFNINDHSTKDGIVFFAMKKPDESLGRYYKATMQQLKDIPGLCLVLCRENIELKQILQ